MKDNLIGRLATYFILVAAFPMVIVGYSAFDSARDALKSAESEKLLAERDLRKSEVINYLHETVQNLKFMADTPIVRSATETLTSYHEYGRASLDAPYDVSSQTYEQTYNLAHPFFESFMKTHSESTSGYRDLLIMSAEDGNVMYTAKRLVDLGANLNSGDLKDSGCAKVWQTVKSTSAPAIVDFSPYNPVQSMAAFVGVPIISKDSRLIGVLAVRLGSEKLTAIFAAGKDSGSKVTARLVGQDYLVRSQQMSSKGSGSAIQKVETESVRNALKGISAVDIVRELHGDETLTAYSPVGLSSSKDLGANFEWAVVAEVPTAIAFKPVDGLRLRVLWIGALVGVVVLFAAFLTGRGIARPVVGVAKRAEQIRSGDLRGDVPKLSRSDQLGALVNGFGDMVRNLRQQIGGLMDGVKVLSNAYADISHNVAKVAESAARTSSAVAETTTTVEQLKQAARLSIDRAKIVVSSSQVAVEVADSGRKATEATVQKIHLVEEQMQLIARTVVSLSDHSRAIEQIMSTVQDLSSQSNLLAVNASIEAARAGEHGKSFAVVAQEIKMMADQSKEAAEEVRRILDETQKRVSEVVIATEQGGKAVQAGVEQSIIAGESIDSLAAKVEKSAEEAMVIESSSSQQHTGVSQIVEAMASIESAVKQNLDSVQQLEMAAQRLEALNDALKDFVQYYSI